MASSRGAIDNLAELMEKMHLINFEPGGDYWVDVTHINNPSSFYVRPTAYRRYMNDVQSCGDHLNPDGLHIQSKVVFNSKKVKKLIRGLIVFVDSNETTKYDMFAPDYGFIEKCVEIKDIFTQKANDIPPLATHCQLADCKPIGNFWTDKAIGAMKFYVAGERALMYVREKLPQVLTVDLINSLPDDIGTMLAFTNHCTKGYEKNTISRLTTIKCEKLYFTHKQLKENDVLHVRLQAGKELNEFYVAEKKSYTHFLNERKNVTYFTKKLKELAIEDFEVDKPVAVFMYSSSKYERAVIKEILSDSRARLQLVDWGKIIEEHISSIKPMSEKFFYYPAEAIYCSVEENQMAEPGLQKYLYPGYEFLIEIKEVGEAFIKPHIVKIMPLSWKL